MGVLWSTTGIDEDWPPRPDPWLFESGDWQAVQQALGTLLPTDYTEIVGEGIACIFGGELTILSPFDPNPNCNLFRAGAENIWAVAYFRRAGWPEHTVPLYPEPGGLLSWGRDNNGAQYFWDTASGDPETWTTVVDGRPVDPPMQRNALGLSRYLDALRSGTVQAAAYGDWPPSDARIERRTIE
jgi:hypothetical protein